MKQRIISGVIVAAAVIGLGFIGSYPLTMAVMICSLIGYLELAAVLCPSRTVKNGGAAQPSGGPDLIALPGFLFAVLYYAGLMGIEWRYGLVNADGMRAASDFWAVMLMTADFLVTMGIYVFTFPRRKSHRVTGALAAFLYAPVLMSFLVRTRNLRHGIYLYLLIFVCASITDVCALAAGMAFGKHKLAPVLSPKKTIEGAVGGVLGSAAVSCVIALALRFFEPGTDVLPVFLIIGICGSLIGQTGDLAASAIKRNAGIKDYGNLIPGHGGIMDRFDSVLFTAPVIYYLSFLLAGKM
ncbi:MAG: phosphatidate cytidylyltransferase [Eubacteriales bacterium]|nr:phosphatidate cytidylyltransferase [Eubacteriales bacterium]